MLEPCHRTLKTRAIVRWFKSGNGGRAQVDHCRQLGRPQSASRQWKLVTSVPTGLGTVRVHPLDPGANVLHTEGLHTEIYNGRRIGRTLRWRERYEGNSRKKMKWNTTILEKQANIYLAIQFVKQYLYRIGGQSYGKRGSYTWPSPNFSLLYQVLWHSP